MRVFFLVALFFCMLLPQTGHAEILAVCGGSSGHANLGNANPSILRATLEAEAAPAARLALWRDDKGFDLLLNWGAQNQHSLRSDGAEIIGNEMGSDLFHLVVIRAGSQQLEHFLFSLEEDAPGQMIWNGPEDAAGNGDFSPETACFKLK